MRRKPAQSFYLLCMLCMVCMALSCTRQLYRQAIQDAAHPSPAKICQCLTVINKENPNLHWNRFEDHDGMQSDFVLMASWKKVRDTIYYHNDISSLHGPGKFYGTKSRPVFVTAFPDLQQWYSQESDHAHMEKRLTQLLGLPPDTSQRVFILFWVRPQDLIRPCLDPEIDDNTCDYKISSTTTTLPDCDNLLWLTEFTRDQYIDSDLYQQYPFTQLGYTYDWKRKNKQHVGLSEFVIGKDKFARIAGIMTNEEYLKASVNTLHLN